MKRMGMRDKYMVYVVSYVKKHCSRSFNSGENMNVMIIKVEFKYEGRNTYRSGREKLVVGVMHLL